MSLKNKQAKNNNSNQYLLPSSDQDLKNFIDSKKIDMMEQTIDSIEYAVANKMPMVEVFQFKNSEFVVLISNKDFLINLEHIYDYYMENEMYELCGRVVYLMKYLSGIIKLK